MARKAPGKVHREELNVVELRKISPKHLQPYVSGFAGKHNVCDSGTLVQMRDTVAWLVGRNLLYCDLIADNGLSLGSGAQSLHTAK